MALVAPPRSPSLPALSCALNASIHAGPEEPAAINPAAFRSVCQWQNRGFHRYFAGFPGFSLENPVFTLFFGFFTGSPAPRAPSATAPAARLSLFSRCHARFGKQVYAAHPRR